MIPALAGISPTNAFASSSFRDGFGRGMWMAAAVCAAGGVIAWLTIRNPGPTTEPPPEPCAHCPLDAPPLRTHHAAVAITE
jgi:hypothetical protein